MIAKAACRDCLTCAPHGATRCPACGSPRLLDHSERDDLRIAHIDCDAFYAAVEKRDNSALQLLPLIIGGGRRGVVSTCCYIARTFGVRSAMPMFQALKLCPHATVIRPDMKKYVQVGRQVRQMMHDLTPLVEPVSIDEAFLDLSGTQKLHGSSPALTLVRFAIEVQAKVGISVSIGLSYCKFLSKIASDLDKPRGFTVIGRAEAREFLKSRPVGMIWGVGKVAQARLARDGIKLIGDLQSKTASELGKTYGEEGLRLARLAIGEDARRVSPFRETKSISAETTFEADFSEIATIEPILLALCERIALRLRQSELAGSTITLKLKSADFRLRTRSRSSLAPTQLSTRIFAIGREMLHAQLDGTRYRLIGICASQLQPGCEADPTDLLSPNLGRDKATEAAIETLRARFGDAAITRGLTFKPRAKMRK